VIPTITQVIDRRAYKTLTGVLKKTRGGLTVADMAAKTALPLAGVQELIPAAADEYGARLEVTESGEILYSFPNGFTSRYRGLGPSLRRFAEKALGALGAFLRTAFKIWIMVMLIGYFALFILIALAALLFFMAASASSNDRNNNRRNSDGFGGALFFSRMMDLVFRFWFYSSLMRPDGGYRRSGGYPRGRESDERPMYQKVFSFVFGGGDPNGDWERRETTEVIAYLKNHRGVISLPEFMILTGLDPQKADREILAWCAKYGGMPEATEDGTVVYRFDPMLLSAERAAAGAGRTALLKKTWSFSANKQTSNTAFAVINGANLAFGAYFLYFVLNPASPLTGQNVPGSFLFAFVCHLLAGAGVNPMLPVAIGLGIVPVLFSLFFWIIPAVRAAGLNKKNAAIDLENRRKKCFEAIWDKPLEVSGADQRLVMEIGTYSVPDVSVDSRGVTVYAFNGLDREKKALEKYRSAIDADKSKLGAVVFDSEA
jgi:hypothetical protein